MYEGIVWGSSFGFQNWMIQTFGVTLHDSAGSIVVHGVGGWLAFGAVIMLGARLRRYRQDGTVVATPPFSISLFSSRILDPVCWLVWL